MILTICLNGEIPVCSLEAKAPFSELHLPYFLIFSVKKIFRNYIHLYICTQKINYPPSSWEAKGGSPACCLHKVYICSTLQSFTHRLKM